MIAFGDTSDEVDLKILQSGDSLILLPKFKVDIVSMATQGVQSTIDSGKAARFNPMTLYRAGSITMVMKQYFPKAIQAAMPNDEIIKDQNTPDAFTVFVKSGKENKTLTLWGGKGFDGQEQSIKLNGMDVKFSFGSLWKELPFSLKLDRFILERYPGSNSPASFQSNITLIDNDKKYFRQDSIYMNNVLQYHGYRFYQSSYDEDEKGTYLSVNDDMPGTIVSYLGYLLLAIGFAANLLNPKSRFRWLLQQTSQVKSAVPVLLIFAFQLRKSNGSNIRFLNS
ncbi:MAG: cytochrome c biogenesis protein ResB [Bacteroidales bacterium]|nr:cytochrome c biogenesis protein ResB [Bacteroidales bacterium]